MASQNSLGKYGYSIGGGYTWFTPGQAVSGDLTHASASIAGTSAFLKVDGFSFSIPPAATVQGFEVAVLHNAGLPNTHHVGAHIVRYGAINTADDVGTLTWPIGQITETLGSPTDKMGLAWAAEDVNASGFGFAIKVSGSDIADVDEIKITVHYFPSGDGYTQIAATGIGQYAPSLFICGHQDNVHNWQYDNVNFDTNKEGTNWHYSSGVDFDYGYWKMDEGSGNILYPVDSNHESGVWQHAHVGEPDWFQGMDTTTVSGVDPLHIEYGNFGGGKDLEDVYERAVRVGTMTSEDTDRTFKFDTGAPTGDFTIFMALTHSGELYGNALSYMNSGDPFNPDYLDLLINVGYHSTFGSLYNVIVYDELGNGWEAVVQPGGGKLQYGDNKVRPLIAATYGGPSGDLAIYVGDSQYTDGSHSLGFHASFRTSLTSPRRVVSSGNLFLPGPYGSYGFNGHPSYYEEFGIANKFMTSGEVYDLFKTHIRKSETASVGNSILASRKDLTSAVFDTTNKGHLELNVPNYDGEVNSHIEFNVRPDSSVFYRLHNDQNAMKVNAFIKHETNNPSGVEVIFGNTYLDWSGHPIILPSGEHYIEVTGSFPNGKYQFNELTGAILDTELPRFKARFKHIDQGDNLYTSNTKLYGVDVTFSGNYKPDAFNDDTTLYTFGVTGFGSGAVNMYTSGSILNEFISLYTFGALKENDNETLYIYGKAEGTSGKTLYTYGKGLDNEAMTMHTIAGFVNSKEPNGYLFIEGAPVSGVTTLYVRGVFADNSNMNLYIKGNPPGYGSGNIPLYLFPSASGQGAGFKTTPLYIDSFSNPYPSGSMNLFLSAPASAAAQSITNTMNLFMKGFGDVSGFQEKSNNISMFIDNEAEPHTSGLTMFLKQQRYTNASGYVPVSGCMNLFINRQFESVSHNLPMWIAGPSGENDAITMFMHAAPNDRSGVSMYIDGIGGLTKNQELYINGF